MSDKVKTLILLTPGFAKDEADTNCLPMHQELLRSLKCKFPSLRIMVLAFDYPYFKKKYKWFDIEVTSFDGRNKGGLNKLLLWRRILKELEAIKNSSEIVGLLSLWLDTCALVGKKFADKNNLKHYCWLIGQDARPGNKYVERIKPRPSELVALSDFIQSEFERNYEFKPAYLIPPGIDERKYISTAHQRTIDVVAAGSLIPLKQFDIFLNVVYELKKQFPQIYARLIGEGPERKKLERIAKSLELDSNVLLTGELKHVDVISNMANAKLFLHTSSYEAFGMVCLEALASGATVISFVKPMNREIKNWHTVNNKVEMVQKALEILSDNDRKFEQVIPYRISETAANFSKLFDLENL